MNLTDIKRGQVIVLDSKSSKKKFIAIFDSKTNINSFKSCCSINLDESFNPKESIHFWSDKFRNASKDECELICDKIKEYILSNNIR